MVEGDFIIFSDISFNVKLGDLVVVVGIFGLGKFILLSLLVGFD